MTGVSMRQFNSRKYTKEQLAEAVKESLTAREALIKLGVLPSGGNYPVLNNNISFLRLDITHWTKKKETKLMPGHFKPRDIKDYLVEKDGPKINSYTLKKKLISKNLIQDICSTCNLKPIWEDKPLSLHLDHINGIHHDNRLENLRLLCPNCHSQTSTFGIKNSVSYKSRAKEREEKQSKSRLREEKTKLRKKDLLLKAEIKNKKELVDGLKVKNNYPIPPEKINWPSLEELEKLVWAMPRNVLAEKLGVSPSAIAKRCKKFNIKWPASNHFVRI